MSEPLCVDERDDCAREMEKLGVPQGGCPSGLLGSCRQACTGCCGDTNPRCLGWALGGECHRNTAFMNNACKLSCHQCEGDPARVAMQAGGAAAGGAAAQTVGGAAVDHGVLEREPTAVSGAVTGAVSGAVTDKTSPGAGAAVALAVPARLRHKGKLHFEVDRLEQGSKVGVVAGALASSRAAPIANGEAGGAAGAGVAAAALATPATTPEEAAAVERETPLGRWERNHPTEVQLGSELALVLLIGLAALACILVSRRPGFLASQQRRGKQERAARKRAEVAV